MRTEAPDQTGKIICFPSPKNVGYMTSPLISGYLFGSPGPIGNKTSCGGRLSVVTTTHFLSGDMDQGRPSPRRTAGVPRMLRTYAEPFAPTASPLSLNATISPSSEMAPMSDRSNHDKSRSSVECAASAFTPTRQSSRAKSTLPSGAISCIVRSPVPRATNRSLPAREIANMRTPPDPRTPLNQSSFPSGDHANPVAPSKFVAITLAAPFRSQISTDDPLIPPEGWSTNAIDFPSGEKRAYSSSPLVDWNSALPIGNSSLPLLRTIARPEPSGAQSADVTSSAISRGVPPSSETVASVPAALYTSNSGFRSTARSPLLEIESSSLGPIPRGRASVPSTRLTKISLGLPSHAAP